MSQINSFRDLIVYQKAYDVSKEIFEISKEYPNEEKYSLTDQIRRSSRSVCANISEAWAKKIYIKHFVNRRCILSPKGSILLQCEAKQGEEGDSLIRQYPRDASYSNVV